MPTLESIAIALHLLAGFLWLGHMVFWSVVVGPVAKRFEPEARREEFRAAAHRYGGLGWPALITFFVTGLILLNHRGLLEGEALAQLLTRPPGWALVTKLVLVSGMVGFQLVIGHRPAPKLIYLNMLAAFVIVGISVLLVRHGALGLPVVGG